MRRLPALLVAALVCACTQRPPPEHAPASRTTGEDARAGDPHWEDPHREDTHGWRRRRYLSFETAKRLLREVYADHRVDLYCACAYDEAGAVDAASCGYERRGRGARGGRIEWEHVVPASRFGAHRACWTAPACDASGRECCGRTLERGGDEQFRRMIGDLHNLVPAVGQLNADRSDRDYGEVEGEPRDYGACDFEIDRSSSDGLAEPPASVRGDVARIWAYMWVSYPGAFELTADDHQMLAQWMHDDPPDAWEFERDDRIATVQGNRNPFLRIRSWSEGAAPTAATEQ